jgi:hypothetical protein
VFPRQRGRISLNNELTYSSYQNGRVIIYINVNPFIKEEYTYEFQYAYVKMNNMLRYKFFLNNLIIFVNGGISNGFVVDDVNSIPRFAHIMIRKLPVLEKRTGAKPVHMSLD